MVCPKLKKGICKTAKSACKQKYEIKMQKFKDCRFFKRRAVSKSKTKIKSKKKR